MEGPEVYVPPVLLVCAGRGAVRVRIASGPGARSAWRRSRFRGPSRRRETAPGAALVRSASCGVRRRSGRELPGPGTEPVCKLPGPTVSRLAKAAGASGRAGMQEWHPSPQARKPASPQARKPASPQARTGTLRPALSSCCWSLTVPTSGTS
ncbi:hypothetical protein [Paenibacillus chitinolyticus]|uniref:hypothetical protein n=1 Tax=Paenibacillus chitinolyticus TaxID=79263 RepID=UPI00295E9776|nr:hypothetical protein [Paenibacillus chitinolyticus]